MSKITWVISGRVMFINSVLFTLDLVLLYEKVTVGLNNSYRKTDVS